MPGPKKLRDGDLAHVHALVKVIFTETVNGVPGASVRDTDGNQQWVPLSWLMRLDIERAGGRR